MAAVVNSKGRHLQYLTNGEPNFCVESEGDLFIKTLAEKQLNTYVSLGECLAEQKKFKTAHEYLPATEFAVGTSSLQQFVTQTSEADAAEKNSKIQADKDNIEKLDRVVSRHTLKLALSVKPDSLETKLWQFATSCKKLKKQEELIPADHPINHLDELQNKLFSHLDRPSPEITAKTVTRKRKQLLEALSEPIGPQPKPITTRTGSSLWDVTDVSTRKSCIGDAKKFRTYMCESRKPKKLYTIINGKIVPLRDTIQNETLSTCVELNKCTEFGNRKLSVEEIRDLPHFRNYEQGTPSKVLYLKNLSSSVTEEDLSKLFEKFKSSDTAPIMYKLMKNGKMRGQAFVTFPTRTQASEALQEINGLVYEDKPIIAQYGKAAG